MRIGLNIRCRILVSRAILACETIKCALTFDSPCVKLVRLDLSHNVITKVGGFGKD